MGVISQLVTKNHIHWWRERTKKIRDDGLDCLNPNVLKIKDV
jgi:hypothetical protein